MSDCPKCEDAEATEAVKVSVGDQPVGVVNVCGVCAELLTGGVASE